MNKVTTSIIVVGGGTGGTLAANLLGRQLLNEIRSGQVKVYLVSGSRRHIFQPGYLHVAFKGQNPTELIREQRSLVADDVRLLEEDAKKMTCKPRQ